ASKPRGPPLSVVLADWLSITPADGLASRPARSRACCSSRKLMVCQSPCRLPSVEVALHRRAVRKIARQIQQRFHHRPKRHPSRPSEPLRRRQMRLDQRPFRVAHVTCIAQIFSPILPPSGFSPHVVSPVSSDTPRVAQLAEITQFISNQPLMPPNNERHRGN